MERYSNLKVYGNIKQVADQGTDEDDVLKVAGVAPLTSTPDTTSTGATPVYYKGQMAVVDGATSICSAITNDAGGSAPTSSTIWTYTWTPVGDPNGVSNPDGSAAVGNVVVFANANGKVITDSGKTLNDGKLSIKGKSSTVIAEFTANQSSASSFEINAGTSLDITNDTTDHKITINHNTAVSGGAGTIGSDSASSGATVAVPYATFDAQGHITGKGTHTHTINSLAASTISSGTLDKDRLPTATTTNQGAVTIVQGTSDSSTTVPTETKMEQYVTAMINALPEPMIFKGTVGTSGATITYTDTASSTYKQDGWTYKAITAGTVNTNDAVAIGDTIIYNGTKWEILPSGDEPSGTVTNVAAGTGLTTSDIPSPGSAGDPITTSGTINLASSGVTAGSYGPSADASPAFGGTFKVPYVTIDTYGRETAASEKTITLPGLGTTNTTAAYGDHTHTTSLATDTGTSTVSLAASTKYKLTTGGTSVIFTTPADTTYSGDTTTITISGTTISQKSGVVTAGSKGSATKVPTITVDTYGRVTALSENTVTPAWGDITSNPIAVTDVTGITEVN